MSKILIAYYSRKGENYWDGKVKNLDKGNTEIVAEMIADLTGGDLFEVDTLQPYPENYTKCTEVALEELKAKARPLLKSYPGGMDNYDTIFVGYPNWWGTMPMAMFTFLEHYDLSGKTIIPFCTNEGSGLGSSERDLKNLVKDGVVKSGFAIIGHKTLDAYDTVLEWIKEVCDK